MHNLKWQKQQPNLVEIPDNKEEYEEEYLFFWPTGRGRYAFQKQLLILSRRTDARFIQ